MDLNLQFITSLKQRITHKQYLSLSTLSKKKYLKIIIPLLTKEDSKIVLDDLIPSEIPTYEKIYKCSLFDIIEEQRILAVEYLNELCE